MIEDIYKKSKVQLKIIPTRHDLINGRWYESEKQFRPSVTTFLHVIDKGIGFMKWLGNSTSYESAMEYSNKRVELGSNFHTMVANMIFGESIETDDLEVEEIKRLQEFVQFWGQAKPTPIATEYPMWHKDVLWAGTADLICDITNKKGKVERWLLDWKTGQIWSSYKYQISAYKYLAEKCFGFKIDRVALVQFKGSHRKTCNVEDEPKYLFKEQKVLPLKTIQSVYDLWILENGYPKPKFPTKYPKQIKIGEDDEKE